MYEILIIVLFILIAYGQAINVQAEQNYNVTISCANGDLLLDNMTTTQKVFDIRKLISENLFVTCRLPTETEVYNMGEILALFHDNRCSKIMPTVAVNYLRLCNGNDQLYFLWSIKHFDEPIGIGESVCYNLMFFFYDADMYICTIHEQCNNSLCPELRELILEMRDHILNGVSHINVTDTLLNDEGTSLMASPHNMSFESHIFNYMPGLTLHGDINFTLYHMHEFPFRETPVNVTPPVLSENSVDRFRSQVKSYIRQFGGINLMIYEKLLDDKSTLIMCGFIINTQLIISSPVTEIMFKITSFDTFDNQNITNDINLYRLSEYDRWNVSNTSLPFDDSISHYDDPSFNNTNIVFLNIMQNYFHNKSMSIAECCLREICTNRIYLLKSIHENKMSTYNLHFRKILHENDTDHVLWVYINISVICIPFIVIFVCLIVLCAINLYNHHVIVY